jgi:hypothetical protein
MVADRHSVAQRISIRNAIGNGFSPLFIRLFALARIEALFIDTRKATGRPGRVGAHAPLDSDH